MGTILHNKSLIVNGILVCDVVLSHDYLSVTTGSKLVCNMLHARYIENAGKMQVNINMQCMEYMNYYKLNSGLKAKQVKCLGNFENKGYANIQRSCLIGGFLYGQGVQAKHLHVMKM